MNVETMKTNTAGEILKFSIPAIIAMLLTSLITVTDGFFTGNYVGKEGLASINLGIPLVYLYLGLGLMISVGGSVIAGMALGASDKKKCNQVFNQTVFLSLIVTLIVSALILVLFKPISVLLGAGESTYGYFRQYYLIMLLELPVMVLNNTFGMFVRGEGNPQFFMQVSIVNVVLNAILDALFAGKLKLGILGIAVSSLICSVVCCLWLVLYFVKQSRVYKFRKVEFDRAVLRETFFNGSSEFIGEMSMAVTMLAYNRVIMKNIGVDGVTAFTIVGYTAYLFSMILIGFGQGSSPLISFSYGAEERGLAKKLRKTTNGFVLAIGVASLILLYLLSGWYSGLFVKNDVVEAMVKSGVMIFALSFLFSGVNSITSFYFTSIGKAKESAVISSLRGLIILLACIAVLPALFGMTGVWMSAPVTEAATLLVSICFILKNDR